jgi:integrase/recombinase XerD
VRPRPAPPPELAGRWLSKFFTDHLAGERAASPKTVSSYRDAMKLLLTWFRDAERIPPEKLRMADIDRARVLRFLDWLEAERNCSATTRNQRLAVIKSFSATPPSSSPAISTRLPRSSRSGRRRPRPRS